LVNSGLSMDIFPNDLKLAKVILAFKKGDKLDVNNYRPIQYLYYHCFQRFLKVIHKRLSAFFDEHSVPVPN